MRGRGPREIDDTNSADPADLSTVQGPQRPIRSAKSAHRRGFEGQGSWVPSLRPLRSAESANRPIGRVMRGRGPREVGGTNNRSWGYHLLLPW